MRAGCWACMHARADVACMLVSVMRRCIAAGSMLRGCHIALVVALKSCVCMPPFLCFSSDPILSPCRYKRVITCKTYLKRLNITQPMAEHLLPPHNLTLAGRPRTSADGSSDGENDDARRGGSSYDQLFKEQVVLVDEQGGSFKVQYEGVACNAQKHLRLTCGWRDYIRHHNVEVGECWDG